MKNDEIVLILVSLIFVLLFSYSINAGVGGTYLPENTKTGVKELRIHSGNTGKIIIYPQNKENESILFRIEFTKGKEFLLTELKEFYEIPPNTLSDDFKINLTFKPPENATFGDTYEVEYRMSSTTNKEREEGMVGLSPASFVKKFNIVIIPKEEKEIPSIVYYISIGSLIILSLSIIAIVKIKKKKKY